MKKTIFKFILWASLILALFFVFYQQVYLPKTTYQSIQPIKGNLQVSVFGVGELSAKHIYPVTAETGGKLMYILTDEGQWVKKGQVIAQIDPVDLPDLLIQAKQNYQKAKIDVLVAQKNLASLQAQLKMARLDRVRNTDLIKKGFSTRQAVELSQTNEQKLQAEVLASQARIESAKAQVRVQQTNINALTHKLERLTIYAPINGFVMSRDAEVAQNILPTQPIVKVVDINTIWVRIYIDERLAADIQVGQSASIVLRGDPKKTYSGIVKRILTVTDPITHEREINIGFNKLPMPFYIQGQAEARIHTKALQDVLIVPAKAITYYDEKPGVWVAQKGHAHFQPLQILGRENNKVAVNGITLDTHVLLASGKQKPLSEGMKIHLKPEQA